MKGSSKYLIIYSNQSTSVNYFGFGVFEKKDAAKYMKCVEMLTDDSCVHEINDEPIPYNTEDFTMVKLSSAEFEKLKDIFDFADDDETGVFPNAINDAYENDLIEEDDSDDK